MPLCLLAGSGQGPWLQLAWTVAAGALGCGLLVWLWREPAFDATSLTAIVALSVALRLVAFRGTPLLEDDYFRYLWDGFQLATTGTPYRLAPAAFFTDTSVPAAWQQVLSGINYPDIPTIYGPVLELLFAAGYAIAPGDLNSIRGLLLLVDIATLVVLARAGVSARWLLALAVHPLVLKEAVSSAHPDALVGLLLVLAMLAWRQAQPVRVGLWLAVAVAAKVAALVAVPLLVIAPIVARPSQATALQALTLAPVAHLWAWAWRVGVAFALGLLVLYAPWLWQGADELLALHKFGTTWRFNPLLFRLVELVVPGNFARPVAGLLVVLVVVLLVVLLVVGLMFGSMFAVPRARQRAMPPVAMALTALLLLAPVVNPWYWMWALAPAVLLGEAAVLGAGACALVAYGISPHTWGAMAVPQWVGWALAAGQCGALAGVAACQAGFGKKSGCKAYGTSAISY